MRSISSNCSGTVPDYSLSTVVAAARLFMTGSPEPIPSFDTKPMILGPLEGLSHIQRPCESDEFPSWFVTSAFFNASKRLLSILPATDHRILALEGFCFDEFVGMVH